MQQGLEKGGSVLDGSDDHLVTSELISYPSFWRRGGLCLERREAVDGTAGGCNLWECAAWVAGRGDATRGSRRSEDADGGGCECCGVKESCQLLFRPAGWSDDSVRHLLGSVTEPNNQTEARPIDAAGRIVVSNPQ